MRQRLLFTGVGGQGVLTGAHILAKAFLVKGEHVIMSEVHGMAQRGGSVICTVCVGDVASSLIADGSADAIVSMEPVEALRSIQKLEPGGIVLTGINPVIPPNVSMGYHDYPPLEDVFGELGRRGKLMKIDALVLAKKACNAITKNIVMLGALTGTGLMTLTQADVLAAVRTHVPDKYVDMNERAFMFGFKAICNQS